MPPPPLAAPIANQHTLDDLSSTHPATRTTSARSLAHSIRHGPPLHFFTGPAAEGEPTREECEEEREREKIRTAESSDTDVEVGGRDRGAEEKRAGSTATAGVEAREGEEDVLWVEWKQGDERNPFNFSPGRKWAMTVVAVIYTLLATVNLSSYAVGLKQIEAELGLTELEGAFGIAVYAWGFAISPLFLAPISEEAGRNPLYWSSCFICAIFYIPCALSQNLATLLVARFIQGCAGSTGSTMVGGTVADLFRTHERGFPMSIFAVMAFVGTGAGATAFAWVVQEPRLGWRWVQWIQMIITFALLPLMFLIMKETRSSVLLARIAKQLRKSTGDQRYLSRAEKDRPTLLDLVKVSLTRPMVLLFTEPVVAIFSIYVGFAWGILYGCLEAVPYVFSTVYGFDTGEIGLAYIAITTGGLIGWMTNLYQERLYRINFPRIGPEARLYGASVGGIAFAVGCFIFAWTSFSTVHWIAPMIGVVVLVTGIFHIYLAVFNYLADAYLASSALAAQSFSRNLFGGIFPLFIGPVYRALNPRWAATLFGCLATVMAVIPFVLMRYGPRIRARSSFAQTLVES